MSLVMPSLNQHIYYMTISCFLLKILSENHCLTLVQQTELHVVQMETAM